MRRLMVVFGFFVSVICYMLMWRQMIVFRMSLMIDFVAGVGLSGVGMFYWVFVGLMMDFVMGVGFSRVGMICLVLVGRQMVVFRMSLMMDFVVDLFSMWQIVHMRLSLCALGVVSIMSFVFV